MTKELRHLRTDWHPLLFDALRKARSTRSLARVKRIAKILCESAWMEPSPEPDQVEELMRLAMVPDDLDVQVLREAVRVQESMVRRGNSPSPFEARAAWQRGAWRSIGFDRVEDASGKLVSLGLLVRLGQPSNQNDLGPIVNAYLLRHRGVEFVRFIKEQAAN